MALRPDLRSIVLLLLLLALGAACGDGGDRGAGELTGRTFLSESVTVNGEPRALLAGTEIRLTFASGGRLTASAGCNMLAGTVRVADDRLLITDLGSTEMGCDPARHAQDEWLSSVLAASPGYTLDGARLELHRDGTLIGLLDREIADPDRPLRTTVWVLDGIIDGATSSSTPAGTSAAIVFGDDAVTVSIDSCNRITGRVKIASSTIEVDRLTTTDVACTGPLATLQATILAVLADKVTYDIEAASLTIMRSDGKGLTLRADR